MKRCFLLLMVAVCFFQTGCSKSVYANESLSEEPDTILHNNSRYIVVIGDIQMYTETDQYMPYYEGTLNWIASHSDRINLVIHTGDVTHHNFFSEWARFHNATEPFTNIIPFYTAIGNHDYICFTPELSYNHRDSTKFSQFVNFPSTVSHIKAYYEPYKLENILVEESLFNDDSLYLLFLELEPRRSVIHWADSIVKAMPDKNFMLVQHSFVRYTGVRYDFLQYMFDESFTAQNVWDSLVYNNDNIRCVLCGHTRTLSQVLYSQNRTGRAVPQIEFNIQYLPNGGNGYVQLWEFDGSDNVFVRTFNTNIESFVNDSITEFQFRY